MVITLVVMFTEETKLSNMKVINVEVVGKTIFGMPIVRYYYEDGSWETHYY